MLYRTNADAIRPLHEWAGEFKRFWHKQLIQVKERAEANARRAENESKIEEER
jgi:hypothetical protein